MYHKIYKRDIVQINVFQNLNCLESLNIPFLELYSKIMHINISTFMAYIRTCSIDQQTLPSFQAGYDVDQVKVFLSKS